MPEQNITTKYKFDISELKSGIAQANKAIKQANADFKNATAGMDDWRESTEGLQAKLKQLGSILESEKSKLSSYRKQLEENQKAETQNAKRVEELRTAYLNASNQYGKNSAEARKYKKELTDTEKTLASNRKAINDLNITIANQSAKVKTTEKDIRSYNSELEDVTQAQKQAEKSGASLAEELKNIKSGANEAEDGVENLDGGFTVLKGTIASLVADGIKSLIGGFVNLASETREYRTELAKLKTISDEVNNSFGNTKKNYKDLLAVTGDEGATTEAMNNLLTSGFKGDELDEITRLIEGTAIKWKDTLKAEGLSDSIQEWLGSDGANLTGNFAEALERMGYNLEDVQAKTAGFTDAQRRQWIIQTLNNEGLGKVSDLYREQNKGLIEASNATFDYTDVMAKAGQKIEPVTNSIKQGIADVLNSLLDLSGNKSLDGVANKIKGAFSYLIDRAIPAIVKGDFGRIFDDIVGGIDNAIPKITQFATTIVNNLSKGIKENLPNFISNGLVLIDGLVTTIAENVPKLIDSGISFIRNLVQGLMASLPELISKVPEIITKFANIINDNAPKIIAGGVGIIKDLIVGIIQAIPTLVANIPKIIQAIVSVWSAFNWVQLGKNAIKFLGDGIKNMVGWAKSSIGSIKDAIVNTIKNLPQTLKSIGSNGIQGLGNAIRGAVGFAKSSATTILNAVVNGVKDLPKKMLSIGKDVVRGVWDGISSMAGWLLDKIGGWAGDIVDGIADFFEIGSPSKVMERLFKWIPIGGAEGIEDGTPELIKSVKVMADDSVEKARNAVRNVKDSLSGSYGSVNVNSAQSQQPQKSSVVNNYNQYNYSPKPLSRKEIYRNTKNLILSVKEA